MVMLGKAVQEAVRTVRDAFGAGVALFTTESADAFREELGLVVGEDVQAYDPDAKAYPPLYISGLEPSSAAGDTANDITVAAGYCRNSTNTANIALSFAITKQADAAWVAGANQGGWDTGTVANGWGYVFVISNPTTGVVDVLLSASSTSPTLPTGFTLFRYVGEFRRDAGANRAFRMGRNGRVLYTAASVTDASGITVATSPSTTAIALTVPPSSAALIRTQASFTGTCAINLRNAQESITGTYGSLVGVNGGFHAGHFELETDGSSQIAAFANNANHTLTIWTYGWVSRRGRI